MTARTSHRPEPATALPEPLREWVGSGLITPEQAEAIRRFEERAARGRAPRRAGPAGHGGAGASLVVEALAYLGGVLVLVGAGILANLYWQDIPTPLRLVLIGAAAVGLVVAGSAVPDRFGEAAVRLRAVLWALAVAATATFFAVWSNDVLDRADERSLVILGPPTAVVAWALWRRRRTWLQQLALLAALLVTSIGVGDELTGYDVDPPLGSELTWVVMAVWTCLALVGRLAPRVTGVLFGGLVASWSALTIDNDLGIVLGLVTAAAMVVLALRERSLPWLAAAAFGTLTGATRAAVEWFPGRLSAALTLIVAGGLLVGAAVWVARHPTGLRAEEHAQRPADV